MTPIAFFTSRFLSSGRSLSVSSSSGICSPIDTLSSSNPILSMNSGALSTFKNKFRGGGGSGKLHTASLYASSPMEAAMIACWEGMIMLSVVIHTPPNSVRRRFILTNISSSSDCVMYIRSPSVVMRRPPLTSSRHLLIES